MLHAGTSGVGNRGQPPSLQFKLRTAKNGLSLQNSVRRKVQIGELKPMFSETPWSTVVLIKFTGCTAGQERNSSICIKPNGSLLCSEKPATLDLSQNEPCQYLHTLSLLAILILSTTYA